MSLGTTFPPRLHMLLIKSQMRRLIWAFDRRPDWAQMQSCNKWWSLAQISGIRMVQKVLYMYLQMLCSKCKHFNSSNSAGQTISFSNSVEPDETNRNETNSHLRIYTVCHSVLDVCLTPESAIMDMCKIKYRRVYFRNSGVKGYNAFPRKPNDPQGNKIPNKQNAFPKVVLCILLCPLQVASY